MRAAGALASRVLAEAGRAIQPGITTDAIDVLVHRLVVEAGAYPSPLNYGEFPKSVCTSLNEVICHGIPDSTVLEVRVPRVNRVTRAGADPNSADLALALSLSRFGFPPPPHERTATSSTWT